MQLLLEPITVDQKSVFVQMMNLYDYDFTEFDNRDINEHGYFGYPYTDYLWNEGCRFPFFIRVDGRLAGFVIVKRNDSENFSFLTERDAHHINEFFVMKKYRRTGVGTFAARAAFDMFRGKWEVCQMQNNHPARRFWKKVIEGYTKGEFKECGTEGDEWVGFVFENF